MKYMMQNIKNGSFDIKTGSRILRIIGAAKRASSSISSYKRNMGAQSTPPPSSVLTCMLKMILMYFKFLNLIWFFDMCQIIISPIKLISNYRLNLKA